MNPSLSIDDHIMNPDKLESLMLKEIPVVPPDSVIKTFSHLRPDRVDLVMTQDDEGLGVESMIVRQGEWAKFFLDSWFDPIYRTYNFQKAETHALVRPIGPFTPSKIYLPKTSCFPHSTPLLFIKFSLHQRPHTHPENPH